MILSKIPKGWVWTKLGEIAGKLQSGGTPSTKVKEFYENGKIPFVKIEDMVNSKKYLINTATKITEDGLNNSSAWVVPENSLLYSMYASYGVPVINKEKVSTSQAIIAFLPPENLIYIDYVYYYLWSIKPVLKTFIRGTTQENLNGAIVNNLPVPLPPLPEQHRIVMKIEELFTKLDTGVEALKKTQAQLKYYHSSVLKAACEGKLVPTEAELARTEGRTYEPADILLARILKERRERLGKGTKYIEHVALDINGLPALPDGWCWTRFEELLVELKNGYFAGTPNSEPPGIPILRINAVRPLSVSFKDIRYSRIEIKNVIDYQLRNGDLLFTRYNGSPELVGVCGMVRGLEVPIIYPDKLIRARMFSGILPDYLELYFTNRIPRRFIESVTKSTAGQKGISGRDLRNAPVALPPPVEQHRIVAEVERRLSVADKVEKTVEQSLVQAERLRKSILKKAFEGELATQNPEDEPASMLLERIQVERSNWERRGMNKEILTKVGKR